MAEVHPGGDPLARLPHTAPARLPDRVVTLEPASRVVVEMALRAGDGRLNDSARLPSVLLVELMAQAGGPLIDAGPAQPGDHAVLAGIKRLHLHGTAAAGETLKAECTLSRRLGDVYLIACRVSAAGRDLAHGHLQLRHVRRGPT